MKDGTYHPAVAAILQHFDYDHLPPELQMTSALFHDVALVIARQSSGPETTTALRKLLEAKDCAVRAARTERQ